MKKIFFIILICLFLSGCGKKNIEVITKIENEENKKISIIYPKTRTKLDRIIEKDINNIINKYKKTNYNELNVDYVFHDFDNYMSVGIFSSFNNKKYTYTYAYDKKRNKLLTLIDITNDIDVIEEITDSDNFTFNNNEFTFYQNNNSITISNDELNLNIELKTTKKKNKILKKQEKIIDPHDKFIALTFDDGPSTYTNELIEYLNKEGCNATFFILGNKVEIYQDLLNKSISYGNELGNHSFNHKWLTKLNIDEFKEQITKTQNIIKKYTGYTPNIFRPTYGSVNNEMKKNTNLDIVLWNVDTMDWKYKNVEEIVKRATNNLKDSNIILMHDTKKRTVKAVKKIVPILKEKGYKCATISELKEIKLLRENMDEK